MCVSLAEQKLKILHKNLCELSARINDEPKWFNQQVKLYMDELSLHCKPLLLNPATKHKFPTTGYLIVQAVCHKHLFLVEQLLRFPVFFDFNYSYNDSLPASLDILNGIDSSILQLLLQHGVYDSVLQKADFFKNSYISDNDHENKMLLKDYLVRKFPNSIKNYLAYLIRNNHYDFFEIIKGIPPNLYDYNMFDDGMPVIAFARHIKLFKYLLKHGANPNLKDPNVPKSCSLVELLIKRGMYNKLQVVYKNSQYPINHAKLDKNGHDLPTQALKEFTNFHGGVKEDIKIKFDHYSDHYNILKLILSKNGGLSRQAKNFIATEQITLPVLQKYLHQGENVLGTSKVSEIKKLLSNKQLEYIFTEPGLYNSKIYTLIKQQQYKIVNLLVSYGINNHPDFQAKILFLAAREYPFKEFLKLTAKIPAEQYNYNKHHDCYGFYILRRIIRFSNLYSITVMTHLLQHGANPNLKQQGSIYPNNENILEWALRNDQLELLDIIYKYSHYPIDDNQHIIQLLGKIAARGKITARGEDDDNLLDKYLINNTLDDLALTYIAQHNISLSEYLSDTNFAKLIYQGKITLENFNKNVNLTSVILKLQDLYNNMYSTLRTEKQLPAWIAKEIIDFIYPAFIIGAKANTPKSLFRNTSKDNTEKFLMITRILLELVNNYNYKYKSKQYLRANIDSLIDSYLLELEQNCQHQLHADSFELNAIHYFIPKNEKVLAFFLDYPKCYNIFRNYGTEETTLSLAIQKLDFPTDDLSTFKLFLNKGLLDEKLMAKNLQPPLSNIIAANYSEKVLTLFANYAKNKFPWIIDIILYEKALRRGYTAFTKIAKSFPVVTNQYNQLSGYNYTFSLSNLLDNNVDIETLRYMLKNGANPNLCNYIEKVIERIQIACLEDIYKYSKHQIVNHASAQVSALRLFTKEISNLFFFDNRSEILKLTIEHNDRKLSAEAKIYINKYVNFQNLVYDNKLIELLRKNEINITSQHELNILSKLIFKNSNNILVIEFTKIKKMFKDRMLDGIFKEKIQSGTALRNTIIFHLINYLRYSIVNLLVDFSIKNHPSFQAIVLFLAIGKYSENEFFKLVKKIPKDQYKYNSYYDNFNSYSLSRLINRRDYTKLSDKMLNHLLFHGANPNLKLANNKSALHFAIDNEYKSTLKKMLSASRYDIDFNAKDKDDGYDLITYAFHCLSKKIKKNKQLRKAKRYSQVDDIDFDIVNNLILHNNNHLTKSAQNYLKENVETNNLMFEKLDSTLLNHFIFNKEVTFSEITIFNMDAKINPISIELNKKYNDCYLAILAAKKDLPKNLALEIMHFMYPEFIELKTTVGSRSNRRVRQKLLPS